MRFPKNYEYAIKRVGEIIINSVTKKWMLDKNIEWIEEAIDGLQELVKEAKNEINER